jgi:hypothetical protein
MYILVCVLVYTLVWVLVSTLGIGVVAVGVGAGDDFITCAVKPLALAMGMKGGLSQ